MKTDSATIFSQMVGFQTRSTKTPRLTCQTSSNSHKVNLTKSQTFLISLNRARTQNQFQVIQSMSTTCRTFWGRTTSDRKLRLQTSQKMKMISNYKWLKLRKMFHLFWIRRNSQVLKSTPKKRPPKTISQSKRLRPKQKINLDKTQRQHLTRSKRKKKRQELSKRRAARKRLLLNSLQMQTWERLSNLRRRSSRKLRPRVRLPNS